MPDPVLPPSLAARHPWRLDDIRFDQIVHERIVREETWFYVLTAASFVESLSDVYAHNLSAHVAEDPEAQQWLYERWEPEELQHGRALRRYVETVWPDFAWGQAFEGFCADYRPYCKPELLEPTRALEMVARCVVEAGTSGLYGLLHRVSPEPVLTTLAGHIRNDEVWHYRYFYHFFLRYAEQERPSRWQIARVLRRRLSVIGQEDAYLALKNAVAVRDSSQIFDAGTFGRFQRAAGEWAHAEYPCEMTVKMLLKPLRLPATLSRAVLPILVHQARRVVAP